MRKLKFRAWDFDGGWMERDFWIGANGVTFGEPSRYFDTPNTEIEEEPNLIVMQFTGLKDKNGVDIYEGDIINGWIHDPKRMHVVEYASDKYNCGFMAKQFNGLGKIHAWYDGLEVIGNIYENPELLNGED